jgi:N-acetylglucosaminyldiphosphoundecaprenol N-acetyl-beta-D-mannosaminyltransferase
MISQEGAPLNLTASTSSFLGITVHRVTMNDLAATVAKMIAENRRGIISNHNLHSLVLSHQDAMFRECYARAECVHVDGMGIIALGKLFRKSLTNDHRTTYVDLLPELIKAASKMGWRVFYLGSKPGVGAVAASILEKQHEGLRIEAHHGYFNAAPDSAENQALVELINKCKRHLLVVGMGMPRQEHWIVQNIERLDVNVIIPCGAVMDYIAGVVPTPPRWAGKCYLEWLFRLVAEPRRLWRRYLIEPWFILALIFQQVIGSRFPSVHAESK